MNCGYFSAVYRLDCHLSTASNHESSTAAKVTCQIMNTKNSPTKDNPSVILPPSLEGRFIVLVGLMGAGKTNLGRHIAESTMRPFVDADSEIEKAAGCSVEEIFERFDEEYFRDGERRVIARILSNEPAVLATGGGAFMNPKTRKLIGESGVSVWLRADLDLLVKRTERRDHRPLLKNGDHRNILSKLIDERYPIYGEADIIFEVNDEPAPETAKRLLAVLQNYQVDNESGQ